MPVGVYKRTKLHGKRIAAALRGRKLSREHRKALSLSRIGNHNRAPHSAESLWSLVDRRANDECWPWKGHIAESGYGRVSVNGEMYYAHRVIYSLASGGEIAFERDAKALVLHHCDNRACCNPRHLFLGTHNDNMSDMVAKGRQAQYTSTGSPRAKLTAEQVREIRAIWANERMRHADIAKRFGVSKPTIQALLAGRSYRDVS